MHGKSYDISRQQYNTEGLNNFEGNRWFKNIRRKKLLNTVNSGGQTRDRQALFGKLEARGSTRKYYSLMLEARLESSISHDVKPWSAHYLAVQDGGSCQEIWQAKEDSGPLPS